MPLMRIYVWLIGRLVPSGLRPRWREEWLAELERGGWRMLPGTLPDAWTIRRLHTHASERQSREKRPLHPFHALDQDVRYAIRALGRGRAFTFTVIASLAVGIGATTTAFAVVNAALFRPYPEVQAQEDLVRITLGPRGRSVWYHASWDDYESLRAGLPALESLTLAHGTTFAVAAARKSVA
jgi:hypothetical protein